VESAQGQRVVVGLGNPEARYAHTRHNLGFRVVNMLAEDLGAGWAETPEFQYCRAACGSDAILLVKPMTYMNRSGLAVAAVLRRFEVGLEEVLVAVDDVHLDLGRVRMRRRGSDGGHNGLRSIIDTVGSPEFPRLRLGIGAPPEGTDLIAYVLGEFGPEEETTVAQMTRTAADSVTCWAELGMDEAMNRYNA